MKSPFKRARLIAEQKAWHDKKMAEVIFAGNRYTSWNHIHILCQRHMRKFDKLSKEEQKRVRENGHL